MEEIKLSKEEIARVFQLYGLGSKCYFDNKIYNIYSFTEKYVKAYPVNDLERKNMFYYSQCKLLLKPLSSITDEDAIEVAKIADILPWNWFEYKKYSVDKIDHPNDGTEIRVLDYSVRITNAGGIYFYDYSRPNTAIAIPGIADAIDFLRSKGYALPYKGKSLFELGLAIDSSTLKQASNTTDKR